MGTSRRTFLRHAGIGLASAVFVGALPGKSRAASHCPPNIVLILADDMGYGDLTCQNPESKIPTPNVDALARNGRRFTDAHSPSAVCTPTRYGLLTGRYAWRTRLKRGVLYGYAPPLIETDRLTLPQLLREAGYHSACIGKWHLGLGWRTKDGTALDDTPDRTGETVAFDKALTWGPNDAGFDYFFGIAASLDMPPYVYIENDRCVSIPDAVRDTTFRPGLTAPDFKTVEVLPDLTDKAVNYIQERTKSPETPFFLYFSLTAPHTPVVPVDDAKGKSRAGDYGDFVYQVDMTIGRIVEALRAQDMIKNTLIVVTSDNGSTESVESLAQYGHRANHYLRGRKSDAWEGGHRVPFITHWPARIPANTVCDETLCLTDFLATFAAITGQTLPDNAGEDSCNLLPAFLGKTYDRPIREGTVAHSIDGVFAIRRGRWKLIDNPGSGGWSSRGGNAPKPGDPPMQLYCMDSDVREQRNLWEQHPEIVEELKALLERYKAQGHSRRRDF